MTVAEATTLRTNALAALNGTLERAVAAYSTDGRDLRAFSPSELLTLVSQMDLFIDRASNGGWMVMQTRDPD